MGNKYEVTVSEKVTYDETFLYYVTLSDEETTNVEKLLKEKILKGEFDDFGFDRASYVDSDELTVQDYKKIN